MFLRDFYLKIGKFEALEIPINLQGNNNDMVCNGYRLTATVKHFYTNTVSKLKMKSRDHLLMREKKEDGSPKAKLSYRDFLSG